MSYCVVVENLGLLFEIWAKYMRTVVLICSTPKKSEQLKIQILTTHSPSSLNNDDDAKITKKYS